MIARALRYSSLGALMAIGASGAARAQRVDSAAFARLSVGLGVTIGGPADVNQRPKCTELGLPCETPRTMPDFGLVLQGAIRANAHATLVVEGSLYDNNWVDNSGAAAVNHVAALMAGPRLATNTLTFATRKDKHSLPSVRAVACRARGIDDFADALRRATGSRLGREARMDASVGANRLRLPLHARGPAQSLGESDSVGGRR